MKKFVLVTLLVLMTLSCAFAATGQYAIFQYLFKKDPARTIDIFFTDSGYKHVSTYEIDTNANLMQEQIILNISTNRKKNYDITLTFFPMFDDDDPSHEYIGQYKVRIVDDGYEEVTSDFVVNNRSGHPIIFAGPVVSGKTVLDFLYPISFDFSDYIEDYPAGDYTAIIRVEAATV